MASAPDALRTLDTPTRPCSASRHSKMYRQRDTAAELAKAVEADVRYNYRIADTPEFLEKILPVPSDMIESILKTLTKSGMYAHGRWSGMPESDDKEHLHYDPFCKVANTIRDCVEQDIAGTPSGVVRATWVNRADKSPQSANKHAALVRPDCCLVTTTDAIDALDVKIATTNEEMDATIKGTEKKEQQEKLVCSIFFVPPPLT